MNHSTYPAVSGWSKMKLHTAIHLKGDRAMVSFYDPLDRSDQIHVEELLRRGGIEYFLTETHGGELDARQILIAEEDLPRAEQLLTKARH
jgi:hypothetical protein